MSPNHYRLKKGVKEQLNELLSGSFAVYNNDYGNSWETVASVIFDWVKEKKADVVIIDNLMSLNITSNIQDKYDVQAQIVQVLSKAAKQLNVHIHFICHPRKTETFLRKNDISGTSDLTNTADNVFMVHRINNDFLLRVKEVYPNTYLPVRVSLMKKKEQTKINNLENGMVHQVIEVVAGEGFVFGLYNSSVITYADNQKLPANTLVATAVTDKNGNLTISGMYPHGNYYLKELAVPDGWKLSTEKFPVTLTSANKASNENTIVVKLSDPILNELIYIPVTITKTDITGAEKLPGALIEVYDENRKLIYREYTNKNGEIPDMYILTATGNSMIDAGIHEGDMILVRRQETANIGDIVVVWVENEGNTLKRFYRKGKTIILKPENSDMEDIRVKEEDCRIQGVAIWVLKKVGD